MLSWQITCIQQPLLLQHLTAVLDRMDTSFQPSALIRLLHYQQKGHLGHQGMHE